MGRKVVTLYETETCNTAIRLMVAKFHGARDEVLVAVFQRRPNMLNVEFASSPVWSLAASF